MGGHARTHTRLQAEQTSTPYVLLGFRCPFQSGSSHGSVLLLHASHHGPISPFCRSFSPAQYRMSQYARAAYLRGPYAASPASICLLRRGSHSEGAAPSSALWPRKGDRAANGITRRALLEPYRAPLGASNEDSTTGNLARGRVEGGGQHGDPGLCLDCFTQGRGERHGLVAKMIHPDPRHCGNSAHHNISATSKIDRAAAVRARDRPW